MSVPASSTCRLTCTYLDDRNVQPREKPAYRKRLDDDFSLLTHFVEQNVARGLLVHPRLCTLLCLALSYFLSD